MVAAWLEINVGIFTHSHHLLTVYKHKSVTPAMLASNHAMSVSIIHTEAGDLGYVAVKHVLSTLLIEHTPSASY